MIRLRLSFKLNGNRGMTLLELIVALGVSGALVLVGTAIYKNMTSSTRMMEARAQMEIDATIVKRRFDMFLRKAEKNTLPKLDECVTNNSLKKDSCRYAKFEVFYRGLMRNFEASLACKSGEWTKDPVIRENLAETLNEVKPQMACTKLCSKDERPVVVMRIAGKTAVFPREGKGPRYLDSLGHVICFEKSTKVADLDESSSLEIKLGSFYSKPDKSVVFNIREFYYDFSSHLNPDVQEF